MCCLVPAQCEHPKPDPTDTVSHLATNGRVESEEARLWIFLFLELLKHSGLSLPLAWDWTYVKDAECSRPYLLRGCSLFLYTFAPAPGSFGLWNSFWNMKKSNRGLLSLRCLIFTWMSAADVRRVRAGRQALSVAHIPYLRGNVWEAHPHAVLPSLCCGTSLYQTGTWDFT